MDRQLFNQEFLNKLEALSLVSRRLYKGRARGEHVSTRKGSSVDFVDYRAYQVGDDFRSIDWNLYNRLDRLFVKLYAEEEDLSIHILLDTSGSMAYGKPPKLDYARQLGAAMGYVGIAAMDRVGARSFAGGLGSELLPRRGRAQIFPLLEYLSVIPAEGTTSFSQSLANYALNAKHTGLAIVISDLLDEKGYREGLLALLYRRFDVILIQVLDADEIEPQERGAFRLVDMETMRSEDLTLDTGQLSLYRKRTREFLGGVEAFCLEHGIEYLRICTFIPLEQVVLNYLRHGAHLRQR
jgi:uncharacterized protein (DUF58 family)